MQTLTLREYSFLEDLAGSYAAIARAAPELRCVEAILNEEEPLRSLACLADSLPPRVALAVPALRLLKGSCDVDTGEDGATQGSGKDDSDEAAAKAEAEYSKGVVALAARLGSRLALMLPGGSETVTVSRSCPPVQVAVAVTPTTARPASCSSVLSVHTGGPGAAAAAFSISARHAALASAPRCVGPSG